MRFSSVKSVWKYLESIPKFQSTGASAAEFTLSRFRNFCEAIGNPHQQFKSIHVGGTNGKGSTCNILASVLQQNNFKVGVYTSPHVIRYHERFRVDNQHIEDDKLLAFFNEHIEQIEQYELTYFEISTAIAFWWFMDSEVDIACIEVGLGGRLDATNVIDPLACVITSVGLDHTDILGDSIEDIAREKGGIIKQDRPVVLGDLPIEAETEVRKIAKEKQSPVLLARDLNPRWKAPGTYQLTINGKQLDITSNLDAPIQAKNLAIVWQVCRAISEQYPVKIEDFVRSLQQVYVGLGRFEKLTNQRRWYFDGGHNLEAVNALKESVSAVGSVEEAVLVLSLMRDKISPEVMKEFSEFKNIYYYPLALERAATFDDITQWLPKANPFPTSDDHRKKLLQNDLNSELVIFSGSFYFYETVRDWVSTFALN